MEFRILGPLEVVEGDRPLSLGGAKQRAVLAILLTRANEVVSTDTLIDQLWGETPPQTAANVLQGYVSHLRKALGPDVLVTQTPGYMLRLDPDQLDLYRFERLVEAARESLASGEREHAATALRDALALWRGTALADFAYEPFAHAEIARLEELRLAALERRIEADLALGRHDEVVGELEGLVARYPLRERLRADQMLALYRCGRQAEALDAYRAVRHALVDELGIEPGQPLQELEQEILRQDPVLDLAPAAPHAPEDVHRSLLVAPRSEAGLDALLALAEPLAQRPRREIILLYLVDTDDDLRPVTAGIEARRRDLAARGVAARGAAFTSSSPGEDVVALATQQDVDLILLDASPELLERGLPGEAAVSVLGQAPCDVGYLVWRDGVDAGASATRPVLVPFGGAEHEWTAVEIAAWIASARGASLGLLGVSAGGGEGTRDASRLLARASLMVQQVTGLATEPLLVEPGADAVIEAAEGAGLLVVGLSPRWRQEGLGETRLDLVRRARPPVLLVRRGLRPGGLAPRETLTRFTWSLGGGTE